jgi:hypothetical protein
MNLQQTHPLQILLQRLQEVVAYWPKPGTASSQTPPPALQRLLAPGFESVDLLNQIAGIEEVVGVSEDAEGVSLQFRDTEDCTQQATFILDKSRDWKLRSLKFQCPICFGSGLNDKKKCPMCGGTGWGAK